MPPRPVSADTFIRGVVASADVLKQPKGSVSRASNLLLGRRGSFATCDGTLALLSYTGTALGEILGSLLFEPPGVNPYYLLIARVPDESLGPPTNLTAAVASGGVLTIGTTYYYKVTALDGVGGETTVSNEASATPTSGNQAIALTWQGVPNAYAYNVYRATTSGQEVLLASSGPAGVLPLPAAQPKYPPASVTWTDYGNYTAPSASVNITAWSVTWFYNPPSRKYYGQVSITLASSPGLVAGEIVYITTPDLSINGAYSINQVLSPTQFSYETGPMYPDPGNQSGTSGTVQPGGASSYPPSTDTTQQSALFACPAMLGPNPSLPVGFGNANIIGLFPADTSLIPVGGEFVPNGSGGTGGGSGAGGGIAPSAPGGIPMLPQFSPFVAQAMLALGNRFPLQIVADPGSTTNPAVVADIFTITENAAGNIATIVTAPAHALVDAQVGGQIVIQGVTGGSFNGGPYVILSVPDSTHLTIYCIATPSSSGTGGTLTAYVLPAISTFVPAFPKWQSGTAYDQGSLAIPTAGGALYYFQAVQAGTSGSTEPTWPTQLGARVADGGSATQPPVLWQNMGLINSSAPPPFGAGHIAVYAGSLWVFNTKPIDDNTTKLDGPTSLRMSDINNPNSWNPINQAYLDKDDGAEGTGLASFTITAQGIPPEGSLVAFKNYVPYQILGVFGASDFAIQRVKSVMGCLAPRTALFVPGFGLMRWTHLGVSCFDGVEDRVLSEEIRPYLFPENDQSVADITVMDANWQTASWAALCAQPPLYVMAIPVGNSQGKLTRVLCYDLVLKAWTIADLPFAVSSLGFFGQGTQSPVTVLGGSSDGYIQRWQAGDDTWYSNVPSLKAQVAWSFRPPEIASGNLDQRIFLRRLMVRGQSRNSTGVISATLRVNGQPATPGPVPVLGGNAPGAFAAPALVSGQDFESEIPAGATALRFSADISGTGSVEIFGVTWYLVPKTAGVRSVVT